MTTSPSRRTGGRARACSDQASHPRGRQPRRPQSRLVAHAAGVARCRPNRGGNAGRSDLLVADDSHRPGRERRQLEPDLRRRDRGRVPRRRRHRRRSAACSRSSFCPRRAASCQSCGSRRARCQLTDDAARPRHPQRLGPAQPASARRRRAQGGSVLDAAVEALASDPEVSMAEIACRAGVVRATIYVHYPTRESLLEAVTERAVAEVTEAMAAAPPPPRLRAPPAADRARPARRHLPLRPPRAVASRDVARTHPRRRGRAAIQTAPLGGDRTCARDDSARCPGRDRR
jgi:Bacterial regulatory proteins, tetR family